MTIARARVACVLQVSTSDGQMVELSLAPGETMETLDPLAAEALRAQSSGPDSAALEVLAARPARIDRDIDRMPRIPLPRAPGDRTSMGNPRTRGQQGGG
jgi:hypothetical protein